MSERLIPLEGVFNFRDFGGYAVMGGQVKRGMLFRSANLHRATAADQEKLQALGLAVVVDLRRAGERASEPSAWSAQTQPRVIDSDEGHADAAPPHLKALLAAEEVSADKMRDYMLDIYVRMPFEARHRALFSGAFAALAAQETPALVHCAAGKDRTGVLCALVLHALGVSREDVFADYALTNDAIASSGVLEKAIARFSKRLGRPLTADQLRPMAGVEPAYLEAALEEIERRSGSLGDYLRESLGVSEQAQAAIRSHLVAEDETVA